MVWFNLNRKLSWNYGTCWNGDREPIRWSSFLDIMLKNIVLSVRLKGYMEICGRNKTHVVTSPMYKIWCFGVTLSCIRSCQTLKGFDPRLNSTKSDPFSGYARWWLWCRDSLGSGWTTTPTTVAALAGRSRAKRDGELFSHSERKRETIPCHL